MKKLSVYLFLLLFTLQTPSQADDISDFQIEGMSIGDSALDYFSEEEIKRNKKNWFTNNKYTLVSPMKKSSFETYNHLQIAFKTNDSKKIIFAIDGIIKYADDYQGCLKQMDVVSKSIEKFFKNIKKFDKYTFKHSYDKTGKSVQTTEGYDFDNGDRISISCQDWAKEIKFSDSLFIELRTKDYMQFLKTAYE